MIDLHTHTDASDGTLSFGELVREAARVRLKALAITDHDGIGSAEKITGAGPVRLIPGVELTVFDSGLGYSDIHMLGLFIDTRSKPLKSGLMALARERERQKMATVERLMELGYSITYEEVRKEAAGTVGRPHIARVLMRRYPDEFGSIPAVFEKLLGRGKKAYVGREGGFSLAEAIGLVHGAGGLAVMAHPLLYPYDPAKLLSDFKETGGDGMETYYDYRANRPQDGISPEDNLRMVEEGRALAGELGLLESGGSDFHGKNKSQGLGDFGAPDELLPKLVRALRKPL
jgi:predicted metal-dependent phosphoesterase TrpH